MPSSKPNWWLAPEEKARRRIYMKKWALLNAEKKKATFSAWREKRKRFACCMESSCGDGV